jgi:hypothetical protein
MNTNKYLQYLLIAAAVNATFGDNIAQATLWSVDIQDPAATTHSGVEATYGFGNVWNTFNVTHNPVTTTNPSLILNDSSGSPTSATFSITGTMTAFNGGSGHTLGRDYLLINAGAAAGITSLTWQISGLTPGGKYEFFPNGNFNSAVRGFQMQVDTNGDGSLGSGDTTLKIDGNGALFPSVIADNAGVIRGNYATIAGEANWSGFQLQSHNNNAAIGYAGSHLSLGNNAPIRTTAVAKPLDIDGDDIYGTDGYSFFNVDRVSAASGQPFGQNLRESLPSYISNVNGASSAFSAGGFSYLFMDDPLAIPGPAVADVRSGLAVNHAQSDAETTLMNIVLGAVLPTAGFRLGVFIDNGDNAVLTPTMLRVSGSGGDSGLISTTAANIDGDMYFFDILGATPGSLLYISARSGATTVATIGGITFDTIPIPEPSSLALLAFGMISLWFFRTKRLGR